MYPNSEHERLFILAAVQQCRSAAVKQFSFYRPVGRYHTRQ